MPRRKFRSARSVVRGGRHDSRAITATGPRIASAAECAMPSAVAAPGAPITTSARIRRAMDNGHHPAAQRHPWLPLVERAMPQAIVWRAACARQPSAKRPEPVSACRFPSPTTTTTPARIAVPRKARAWPARPRHRAVASVSMPYPLAHSCNPPNTTSVTKNQITRPMQRLRVRRASLLTAAASSLRPLSTACMSGAVSSKTTSAS